MDSLTRSQPVVIKNTDLPSQIIKTKGLRIKKNYFFRKVKRLKKSGKSYIKVPINKHKKSQNKLANFYIYTIGDPLINLNCYLDVKITSTIGITDNTICCRHFATAFSMKLVNFNKLIKSAGKPVYKLADSLKDIGDTKSLTSAYIKLEGLYRKHIYATKHYSSALIIYKLACCYNNNKNKEILKEIEKKISIRTANIIKYHLDCVNYFIETIGFEAPTNKDMSFYVDFYVNTKDKISYLASLKEKLNNLRQCLYNKKCKRRNSDKIKKLEIDILATKKELNEVDTKLKVLNCLEETINNIRDEIGSKKKNIFFGIAYKFMNSDIDAAWQKIEYTKTSFKYFSYNNFNSIIYQMCCNTAPQKIENFILTSGSHAMSFRLKRKKDDSFIITFYDPNTTLSITKYLMPRLINAYDITMKMFGDLKSYLVNEHITTFSHEDKKNISLNLMVHIERPL